MSKVIKKYTLDELKLGMQIKDKSQLDEIYNTWIIMTKGLEEDLYTIEFIGKETNSESDKLFKQGKIVCSVYNDSIELDKNIDFIG